MGFVTALYLVLLAAVAGYVLIARVPSLLHTPMLSGSNFIHGIVLAGAMLALANASGTLELVIGFLAVMAASANVVGGFVVTDRMLNLFDQKGARGTASNLTDNGLTDNIEPASDSIVDGRSGMPVGETSRASSGLSGSGLSGSTSNSSADAAQTKKDSK